MEKLKEQYQKEVVPALMKKFNYKSVMEVPKLEKIVLNVGLGDIRDNPKSLENTINDLSIITGQSDLVKVIILEQQFLYLTYDRSL